MKNDRIGNGRNRGVRRIAILLAAALLIGLLPCGIITVSATDYAELNSVSAQTVGENMGALLEVVGTDGIKAKDYSGISSAPANSSVYTNPYYETPGGKLYYSDGTIVLFDGNGVEADLEIPSQLGGGDVTKILNTAFSNCTNLRNITVPETVRNIEMYTFYEVRGLTSVSFPKRILEIGYKALPAGATVKGYANTAAQGYAFKSDLTFVSIGTASETGLLGSLSRGGCLYKYYRIAGGQLAYYDGDIVGSLGYGAGWSADIPTEFEGVPVTTIGLSAFSDSKALTAVSIPDTVTIIRDYAFGNCVNLSQIEIPQGILLISERSMPSGITLSGYSNTAAQGMALKCGLNFVSVGTSEKTGYIGSVSVRGVIYKYYRVAGGQLRFYGGAVGEAMNYVDGWEASIPSEFDGASVTRVESYGFYSLNRLKSVTLPKDVTSIGVCAFYGCSALESVTLPAGLSVIDGGAFSNCTGLLTAGLTIPKSVTLILPDALLWYDYISGANKYIPLRVYENSAGHSYAVSNGNPYTFITDKMRGDFDGDEKITVADALAALRFAAKLVVPTDDDIALLDIDSDGGITVSDALAILRVAAKLTDVL